MIYHYHGLAIDAGIEDAPILAGDVVTGMGVAFDWGPDDISVSSWDELCAYSGDELCERSEWLDIKRSARTWGTLPEETRAWLYERYHDEIEASMAEAERADRRGAREAGL